MLIHLIHFVHVFAMLHKQIHQLQTACLDRQHQRRLQFLFLSVWKTQTKINKRTNKLYSNITTTKSTMQNMEVNIHSTHKHDPTPTQFVSNTQHILNIAHNYKTAKTFKLTWIPNWPNWLWLLCSTTTSRCPPYPSQWQTSLPSYQPMSKYIYIHVFTTILRFNIFGSSQASVKNNNPECFLGQHLGFHLIQCSSTVYQQRNQFHMTLSHRTNQSWKSTLQQSQSHSHKHIPTNTLFHWTSFTKNKHDHSSNNKNTAITEEEKPIKFTFNIHIIT